MFIVHALIGTLTLCFLSTILKHYTCSCLKENKQQRVIELSDVHPSAAILLYKWDNEEDICLCIHVSINFYVRKTVISEFQFVF